MMIPKGDMQSFYFNNVPVSIIMMKDPTKRITEVKETSILAVKMSVPSYQRNENSIYAWCTCHCGKDLKQILLILNFFKFTYYGKHCRQLQNAECCIMAQVLIKKKKTKNMTIRINDKNLMEIINSKPTLRVGLSSRDDACWQTPAKIRGDSKTKEFQAIAVWICTIQFQDLM